MSKIRRRSTDAPHLGPEALQFRPPRRRLRRSSSWSYRNHRHHVDLDYSRTDSVDLPCHGAHASVVLPVTSSSTWLRPDTVIARSLPLTILCAKLILEASDLFEKPPPMTSHRSQRRKTTKYGVQGKELGCLRPGFLHVLMQVLIRGDDSIGVRVLINTLEEGHYSHAH